MHLTVIALGGNALLRRGQRPTFATQNRNTRLAAKSIVRYIDKYDCGIAITHGNGPQVGEELLRNESARESVAQLPLHILTAETQAFIGSMLESAIMSEARARRIDIKIATVLTHVVVDMDDPAFMKPSKPIGPFYDRGQLARALRSGRFDYVKTGGAFRRAVASPRPIEILELSLVKKLLDDGCVVICAGGGGIPVANVNGRMVGADAVIDKDLTTQLLANGIGADTMVILTDASRLYADYSDKRSGIKEARVADLERMVDSLEKGSIKPKVEACIRFIRNGGRAAYIGNLFMLNRIMDRTSGTMISA